MKKIYISPETNCIVLASQPVLAAASDFSAGGDKGAYDSSSQSQFSRRNDSFWEDED